MLGGAALLSLPSVLPSRAAATDQSAPPLVRIAGQRVELTDPAAQARRIAEEWAHAPQRLQLTEQTLVRTRAELGGSVDVEHLTRLLSDVQNPASALRRRAETASELELALPVRFDAEPARELLLELKRQHDHPPSDARFNPDTREVIPERAGLSLDVWATLDDLDDAMHHGAPEIAVRVVRTDAQRTARVTPRDRAAARPDRVDVDHRQRDRPARDLAARALPHAPALDHAHVAGRAAHVEAQEVRLAAGASDERRRCSPAGRARQDRQDRVARRGARVHQSAAGLHALRVRKADRLRALPQPAEIRAE